MSQPAPPVDSRASVALASRLAPDETLLRAARPDDAHFARLRPRLVAAGLFWTLVAGAGFTGFAVTLLDPEYDGIATGARVVILALCALPFAVVAALALGGHVHVARRAARRTAYGLTDRRVLVVQPRLTYAGPPVVRELSLTALTAVRTTPHATGSTTLECVGGPADEPLLLRACPDGEAFAADARQRSARMRASSSA